MCRERPTICHKRNTRNVFLNAETLSEFSWLIEQSDCEARQMSPRGLFTNQGNFCAMLMEVCGDSKQERTATRYNDALATNWKTGFHKRLQPTGASYIRQRPAGEREKPFPRAGRQD